jgi:hypothetical protein
MIEQAITQIRGIRRIQIRRQINGTHLDATFVIDQLQEVANMLCGVNTCGQCIAYGRPPTGGTMDERMCRFSDCGPHHVTPDLKACGNFSKRANAASVSAPTANGGAVQELTQTRGE